MVPDSLKDKNLNFLLYRTFQVQSLPIFLASPVFSCTLLQSSAISAVDVCVCVCMCFNMPCCLSVTARLSIYMIFWLIEPNKCPYVNTIWTRCDSVPIDDLVLVGCLLYCSLNTAFRHSSFILPQSFHPPQQTLSPAPW